MSKAGSVTGDNAKATYLVGVEEDEGRDIHYVDYTKKDRNPESSALALIERKNRETCPG